MWDHDGPSPLALRSLDDDGWPRPRHGTLALSLWWCSLRARASGSSRPIPKVLHPICGRPALWHVLQAGLVSKPTKIVVVVGHGADDVRAEVASWKLAPKPVFVEQAKQLGTGHAVQVAERAIGRVDDVLVMGGDFDPVTGDDVEALVASHRRSNAAATHRLDRARRPRRLRPGRSRRAARLVEVVEDRRCADEIRAIRRGLDRVVRVPPTGAVRGASSARHRKNRQREYYLNRVVPTMLAAGQKVNAVTVDTGGAMGVNSRAGTGRGRGDRARSDQRPPHGRRRHARRPGRHLHRRRRRDRRRLRDLSEHVPRARLAHRRRVRRRAVGRDGRIADRRRVHGAVLGARGRPGRDAAARSGRSPACATGAVLDDGADSRQLRRGEGLDARPRREGEAPHLPGQRRDRRRREHRRRHRDGELRRLPKADDDGG